MALKPAWEPIVLAMKPMDGTIAHNALTWGVAGMNIEAARIGTESTMPHARDSLTSWLGEHEAVAREGGSSSRGRWPANLLLDADAAA